MWCEVMDVLITLVVMLIPQYIHTSKYYIAYLNYIQFFKLYLSKADRPPLPPNSMYPVNFKLA